MKNQPTAPVERAQAAIKRVANKNIKLLPQYREKYCSCEPMHLRTVDELLDNLQQNAMLDHRLLSYYKAWPKSDAAVESVLSFFRQCFMISSLSHVNAEESSSSLVTARLCDSSDVKRQDEVRLKAAVIEASSEFFAVYAVPSKHIGIIARMQATIEALRPKRIHLEVAF